MADAHAGTASLLLNLSGAMPSRPCNTSAGVSFSCGASAVRSGEDTCAPSVSGQDAYTCKMTSIEPKPYMQVAVPKTASVYPTHLLVERPTAVCSSAKSGRAHVSALPRKEWSAREDELIQSMVREHGCKWRTIAGHLPGRSDDAVRNRWSRLMDSSKGEHASRKNKGWHGSGDSSCGDEKAGAAASLNAVEICGVGSGKVARSSAGGNKGHGDRSGSASAPEKEKKERTSWTRAEDDVITEGVEQLGHKWFEIAKRLPGRTDHAIRNRWSRLQSIMGQEGMLASAELSEVKLTQPGAIPRPTPLSQTYSVSASSISTVSTIVSPVLMQSKYQPIPVLESANSSGVLLQNGTPLEMQLKAHVTKEENMEEEVTRCLAEAKKKKMS